MVLHPITLAFDKEQEKAFQQVYFKESLHVSRVAILLTGLLYAVFGYLDYMEVGENLHTFLVIRFGIVIPYLILVVVFSYTKVFVKIWQYLIAIAFVLAGGGICYMIARFPGSGTYFGGLMLVFSAGYFFVQLRFFIATIAGWTILLIFNLLMIFSANASGQLLIAYNFFYVSANLIGMFATYYMELSNRKNFYLNQQLNDKKNELESINQNLENIVDERTRDYMESEERFRNLSDLLPMMVLEINTKGIITYANQEVVRQTGVNKNEIMGKKHALRFISPENRSDAWDEFRLALVAKGIYRAELLAIRRNKTTFPVMMYSAPVLKNNETIGVRAVLVDLSEQKANEKLRTEIAVAKQSAEFKQNFLANMSHEIRTPLTGVMGIAEILSATPLNETQKEYLHILRQSTENLREIINQILDYSKIEAGKILLRPAAFETQTLFESAAKLFYSINQKPIQLQLKIHDEMPPYICADIQRVRQVISNLLSNAVKFTVEGSITLEARVKNWIDHENFMVRIDVKDTGIGIPEDKQKLLFKPFSQIESEDTRNFEGTGLGLTICKDLTKLMEGEIGLESKIGEGSSFWFTFRASFAKQEDIGKSENEDLAASKTKSLRILLVEDKEVNQKVIGLILSSLGHSVSFADNGQRAIELFRPKMFDLILMDIQMPVMDGITATQRLRLLYNDLPPIVGLSANAFEGDKEKYISRGMDDYLTKPVSGEDFEELTSKWFM